jgi:site-specific DNA-methyltransferase (adenine-specific)
VKHQCPSLAEDSPTLNQTELFEAAAWREAATRIRTRSETPSKPEPPALDQESKPLPKPPLIVHRDQENSIQLYHGNCLDLLDEIAAKYPDGLFTQIFADPPYFLSNNGSTCRGGERVSVNKGQWDKSRGLRDDLKFTLAWLRRCRRVLLPGGTIWISGTHHSIHLVGYVLQRLKFRILNDITWEKINPPPNLACRQFTHSTETLIWAARDEDANHIFNYDLMRRVNRGLQMQTVWRLNAPPPEERKFGEHPTQKPVALVTRCLLATTCEGDRVFDPFLGSGTTAIACLRQRRRFVGIDASRTYVNLAADRIHAETQQGADLFMAKSNQAYGRT